MNQIYARTPVVRAASRSARGFSPHSRAREAALPQVGFWSWSRGVGVDASIDAIDRNVRSCSAWVGKRPLASTSSSVPYRWRRLAAPFGPVPPGTRKLVGRVTAQGYEVGHLLRIHSIAVPHLGWRNPSHFSGAHGIENCGPVRGELQSSTVP